MRVELCVCVGPSRLSTTRSESQSHTHTSGATLHSSYSRIAKRTFKPIVLKPNHCALHRDSVMRTFTSPPIAMTRPLWSKANREKVVDKNPGRNMFTGTSRDSNMIRLASRYRGQYQNRGVYQLNQIPRHLMLV